MAPAWTADHGSFSAPQLSNANLDCEIERKLSVTFEQTERTLDAEQ
jgi:hypothetical protein